MAIRMPQSVALTVDDVYDPPDDGHRYELIDGCLIVTPTPWTKHQLVSMNLLVFLRNRLPPDLAVLPFVAWIVDEHTKLQPDLIVFEHADVDLDDEALRMPPVLVVEISSQFTRHLDLGTKKLAIAAGGRTHYWVVDPDAPSIVAFDLVDGDFVKAGTATGDEELTLERPFPISLVPARLLD
jgi:Uma2 family endonuclease